MSRLPFLGLMAFLLVGLFPAQLLAQQTTPRPHCFRETGYCIGGRLREYWEANGGLLAFGFPITPPQVEQVEGRRIQVQWFERTRMELHPENDPPYDVLLGRAGYDSLVRQKRDWKRFPKGTEGDGCRFFAETQHAVCGDFLTAWQSSGLNLDGDPAINDNESLGLFGLPLSEARTERSSDGNNYLVQWFERARFELHPENPPPYNVLFGLLGREYNPTPATPPSLRANLATRIVIEAIGLDRALVEVGMGDNGEFAVPDHDVGWYGASAAPGNGENVVMWAHMLPFANAPGIPAPFARLKELQIGDRITIYDDLDLPHSYAIAQMLLVNPDEGGFIMPQGRELVTLVACDGEFVLSGGAVVNMTQRRIVIATPVAN